MSYVRGGALNYAAQTIDYVWPTQQMLVWRFIMYGVGGTLTGIFASFVYTQNQLGLGVPWIIPYGITVGALTIIWVFWMDMAILQRTLLPGLVILGAIMFFVLYVAGLIGTSIQLFGSSSNINGNCNNHVYNNAYSGPEIATLAWLQQRTICQCWLTAFVFWLVGVAFMIYVWVLSAQVENRYYDAR